MGLICDISESFLLLCSNSPVSIVASSDEPVNVCSLLFWLPTNNKLPPLYKTESNDAGKASIDELIASNPSNVLPDVKIELTTSVAWLTNDHLSVYIFAYK